ncbi:hypothetical protein SAMN05444358_101365 [Ruegeria halocynthiae]|uniref:Uncharacterized protein n=1 Tax=Ruegeria halocynthiae TaxID=985054 RepID=A0A1H2S5R9_9RHOB|nr:hypothetical protein [Ruegeria halocynthiae]SDW26928.1 hypothetical protein SAMN05444358_101365 [Ruegeria halocynthiae]
MAHISSAPLSPKIRPGVLFAILLTGAIGFALGQNWPLGNIPRDTLTVTVPEDWHGNVRRSNWPN